MLIAVKERTNELGIRRAIGATPGEVRVQIILEMVFLTIWAGLIGIIVGSMLLFNKYWNSKFRRFSIYKPNSSYNNCWLFLEHLQL